MNSEEGDGGNDVSDKKKLAVVANNSPLVKKDGPEIGAVKEPKAPLMTWTVLAVVKDMRLGLCTTVELGHDLTKEEAEKAALSTDRVSSLKLPGAWSAKIITVPTAAYRNFFSNVCRHLRDVKVTDLEEAPPSRLLTTEK